MPHGPLEDVGEQRLRVVRAVQGGRDQPVAVVEVGLPVAGVVLLQERHVPDRDARHRRRPVAARPRPQPVLGVVPLDEQRQRQPEVLGDDPRDQAHPPGVVVDVAPPVQPRGGAQGALGEVVVRLGLRGVAPQELVPVDDLAHRRELRAGLQRQHLAADQHRLARVAGERDGAQHGVGLQQDVVVHEQDLLGLGRRPAPRT